MLTFPNIDPVMLQLGPIKLRWYGMMYLTGFVIGYYLLRRQIREGVFRITEYQLGGLSTAMILGVILGARIGYVLFYDFMAYMRDPLEIFALWKGGMSFHGGLLGTLVAGYIYCRNEKVDYLSTADRVAVVAPVGLGLGRIANFINAELYGRQTDVPWAMVFPGGGPVPRHPSQLYESFLEGLVLFTVLWLLRKRLMKQGQLLGSFLVLYAVFRSSVEFVRQPDAHIGVMFGFLTRGQILSTVMLCVGAWLLIRARKLEPAPIQVPELEDS